MVEFGTSFTFRGWVRVRVLGYGSGVRGRKVKSRDCALASDLVRALCERSERADNMGKTFGLWFSVLYFCSEDLRNIK